MKTDYQNLSKSPIVEAVFEVVTSPAMDWEENSVTDKIKNEYQSGFNFKSETRFQQTIGMGFKLPECNMKQTSSWNGLNVISDDNSSIIKYTQDRFAYSRLKPYPNWDDFSREALVNYEKYKKVNINGKTIKRLGVRFINSLDYAGDDLTLYLKNPPAVCGQMPKNLSGYFQQNRYSILNEPIFINHIQLINYNESNEMAIVIDIDVFTEQFKPDTDIMSLLNEIRKIKNDIFFNSVTEPVIERLK